MKKFKTISEHNKIASVPGTLKVLSTYDDRMQDVELWFLNEKKTRNKGTYRNMERHLPMFAGIPILAAYVDGELGRDSGHNFTEVKAENGDTYASFLQKGAEHIYGYIPSVDDLRIDIRDGTEWLVARGKIWKWYARELIEKLKKQGLDGQQVSVETLIEKMSSDEDGDEVYEEYIPLGVTILGDGVTEAVAGAYIRTLSVNGVEELRKNTKLYVASVYSDTQEKNKKDKGEKPTMKIKLKDLEPHFAGFKVLAVNEDNVALLSDNGVPYLSTASKNGDEIVVGAKLEANAVITFSDGDRSMELQMDAVTDALTRQCEALKADLEKEKTNREAVEKSLDTMQKQERQRRVESVKEIIQKRFEEISKSNPNVNFVGNECDGLMTEEKISEYAALEDCNGRFYGAEKAKGDVDALCMDKLLASQKPIRKMAWDVATHENEPSDKIDSAIANILK